MSESAITIKDKQLYNSTAVSGSSAAYTGSIDLGHADRGKHSDLELVFKLTYTSGAFVASLVGDVDSTIDGSSVVAYTYPSKAASGTYHLPIPKDFNYQYVGLAFTGVAHAGTVEIWVQDKQK
mgnify:CR=1 FL=1